MDLASLVKMANQIGGYFEIYPDKEYATQEVSSHIKRSWDPRMRATIQQRLAEAEALGLTPLAAAAIRRLGERATA
ncbi:formate dehydrogenase [Imbroritus primus]|uniref:Formate dehydrogenase n=1 Tax=Imbroritus primus TaxID=3058603 RepID=A0ACD3SNC3_9BURK|nr:formate dehydrogenase [Burkholderiaceae bacterium PBA]